MVKLVYYELANIYICPKCKTAVKGVNTAINIHISDIKTNPSKSPFLSSHAIKYAKPLML